MEILHVVLLGFVKYLWRDVIDNQLKKNVEKKKELATHLSSVDVAGLGLDSQLTGDVLVNHYRSLTGSDFRKICQVAPCVLKEFVTDECYQTWLSLSKLIPLIWQPEIESLDSYIVRSSNHLDNGLLMVIKISRHSSSMKLNSFYSMQQNGAFAGSTSPNSISLSIYQTTSVGSDLPCFLPQRFLNHIMQSSVPKVSIPID